jgi:2-polyprenyl-6-methoxyphenol hydroxylase-like FAD-dependent oxidoreductase
MSLALCPAAAHRQRLSVIAECTQYLLPRGSCFRLLVLGSCYQPIESTTTTPCRFCHLRTLFEHGCDALQVWQALGAGVLQLKASDAGVESLGSIVGHSVLQAALKQCVMDSDVICIGSDARSITSRPPAAAAAAGHVLSAGDFSVSCALLVGADGAASRVRAHSGIGRASAHVCLQLPVDISTLILFAASAAMNYSSRAVVATLQVTIRIIHILRKNSQLTIFCSYPKAPAQLTSASSQQAPSRCCLWMQASPLSCGLFQRAKLHKL